MVPVRKPGRPLSTCPHPQNQQCGCGSVTAAIPRRQACHCGTSTPPASSGQTTPQDSQSNIDASPPTKLTFKVQKITPRPHSSRKQSFDPANFERMNMNSINIVSFDQRPPSISLPFTNDFAPPEVPQQYGFIPQYAIPQEQFSHFPMQAAPHIYSDILDRTSSLNRENDIEPLEETPLTGPAELSSNDSNGLTAEASCYAPPIPNNETNGRSNSPVKDCSCCTTRQSSHSHSSSSASSISEPSERKVGKCCSSKPAPLMKQESMSSHGYPIMTPQMLPPDGAAMNPPLYSPYLPQTTVFTYPATYGSFQNPLQPSAWRQSVRANSYGSPQMPAPLPSGGLPFDTHISTGSLDTVHTCSCGDGCQCVGCAAHPYNDATQDYVRSAWSSMNNEQGPEEVHANGQPNRNGHHAPPGGKSIASPIAKTPSSTTSANGEEQSLAASDFFFVSYPFSSEDGCGGDTESCPCGDDCQCFGCTIHQHPGIPCEGEKEICPCGDDCECIGCEIHNGTVKL